MASLDTMGGTKNRELNLRIFYESHAFTCENMAVISQPKKLHTLLNLINDVVKTFNEVDVI